MSSNRKQGEGNQVRVELKYCERCGGLWLREWGTGVVYCGSCQAKMAEMPVPKKKRPGRLMLPVGRPSLIDDYASENGNDDSLDCEALDCGAADFEAAGGAA
jgi:uncharacterized Zn finger protein (UPF0148 family)